MPFNSQSRVEGREPPAIPESSADTVNHPPKRRKILNACEPCRRRKIRCDGEKPTCGPCSSRGPGHQTCLYRSDLNRLGAEQRNPIVTGLRSRIDYPDSIIPQGADCSASSKTISQQKAVSRPCSQPSNLLPDERQVNHRVLTSISKGVFSSATVFSVSSSSGVNAFSDQVDQRTSPVNAMGSASFVNDRDTVRQDYDPQFYGDSSSAHFLKQLRTIVPEARRPQIEGSKSSTTATSVDANAFFRSSPNRGIFPASDLSLPPRDLADSLLDNYWVKSHSLYPFIHKTRFIRAYEDIWKPLHAVSVESEGCDTGLGTAEISSSRSPVFHCALNAIFALSCQLSVPGIPEKELEYMSQNYFLRCKSLLYVDIFDHGSMALVQTLLIVAQYLQSTSFPSRCWTVLGLACRIAQGLGLHVESDRAGLRHSSELEIRRRVWYGCIIMDIVASTTLGRPLMIPCQTNIPLPSLTMQDDTILGWPDSASFLSFYVEAIKLYLILSKIVSKIYRPWKTQDIGIGSQTKEAGYDEYPNDTDAVINLDEELSTFEDTIPVILHKIRGIEARECFPQDLQWLVQRQTNVLYARYLHVRILLHRPAFLRFCQRASRESHSNPSKHPLRDQSLRSTISRQSSAICIRSSFEIIALLDDIVSRKTDGAWWYTTFYLSTAGMILILANSYISSHQEFSQEEIDKAWNSLLNTLRTLSGRGHPVEHTLDSLRSIYQLFVSDAANKRKNKTATDSSAIPDSTRQDYDEIRSQRRTGSAVNSEPALGPGNDIGQVQESAAAVDFSGFQSFMNVATADMNLMPFCLPDDGLWSSPSSNMGF